MTVLVYAGSDIDRAIPLHATSIAGIWNGHPIPVVTAAAFSDWLSRMVADDPNGWSESTTFATSFELFYSDENGLQSWPMFGYDVDVAGSSEDWETYALDGWTWSL